MNTRYTIARLGAQGDGVAEMEQGPVFVPFTLPGENVTTARHKDRAELVAVLDASPDRVEPACRHFTVCGGCALQHVRPDVYLAWKRAKVADTLRSRRVESPVSDIVPCEAASRRRATFSARRVGDTVVLGYNRAFSHDIVDIEECPILVPAIAGRLPLLRKLAARLGTGRDPFHLTVTQTASGLDVAATGSGKLTATDRLGLAAFATASDLARLSVDGEIIIEPRKPAVEFGGVAVTPPPGGFLQAVASAEEAMAGLVVSHLAKAKRVADLFCGAGAFALRLARHAEVHAVESDAASLAALDRGFRAANGLRRVTMERRDLFRRPLMTRELDAFDGLVFDPPRAGAEDLCKQLARSDVPKIAAVSCNPTTLARDLEILASGGYTVIQVTPIDQFLWSPHVEAVALLEKSKRRR